jgi:hypothetical protein
MKPKGSLPYTQQPANCPYSESDKSGPCPIRISLKSILILSSHLLLGLPSGLFLTGSPTNTPHATFPHPVPAICKKGSFYSQMLVEEEAKSPKLNHSPSCKAERNGWTCTATSLHICAVWFLFKYRDVRINIYRSGISRLLLTARSKAWVCGRSLVGCSTM